MKKSTKKAFTLTELLVVVIVLGVLAAVAVPKFSRVLETRKTTEAEDMFAAVRTEQEHRCNFGKTYQTDKSKLQMLAGAASSNYTYNLTGQGMTANSDRGYTLKMLSYKEGLICCEGEYCDKLNKTYPKCQDVSMPVDECAGEVQEQGPCDIDPSSCSCNPNQEKCCTSDEKWDGSQCVTKTFCDLNPDDCECNANQEKCCTEEQKWDGSQCVAKTFCELNPDDCTCNPNQAKCCDSGEVWNSSTGRCEEACKESVKVIKSNMTVIQAQSYQNDTCDGAVTRFTCDGVFNGTCQDLYLSSGTNAVTYRFTYQEVTCCGTGGGGGGLGDFKPAEGFCSPSEQLQCTQNGGTWNSSTCECTNNVDINPDRDPVEPGGSMLRWQCTETSDCWIPSNATGTECSPEGSRAPLPIGVGPTGSACNLRCTCVKYFKQ